MGKKSRRKAQKKKVVEENQVSNSVGVQTEPQEVLNTKHLAWQGAFVCLLAYVVCLAFRLFEFPAWSAASFKFNGQYLMATHDAYTWLAGAKEVSRRAGTALSEMIRFFHGLTGFNVANIGFWLPAVFSPLAVLPLGLLAWREKQPEAGLAAGIMAAGCLGFLLRTRLGFVDTDILALFFPVAIASGLIIWLSGLCRRHWIPAKGLEADTKINLFLFLLGAVGIGLLVQGYGYFYGKIHISLGLIGTAFLVALVLTAWQRLRILVLGFSVLVAASFGAWIGLLLGLAACGLVLYRPAIWENWIYIGILVGLALVIGGGDMLNLLLGIFSKLSGYAKSTVEEGTKGAALKLPAIQQSVREAQNVNWSAMASRTAGNWWLFWGGLAGFAYLVWRRPLFLIFLPLLGLGIASVKLGNRFAMFGGAALGVGLAFGVNQVLVDLKQKSTRRWVVQIVLCLLVIWPLWKVSNNLRPAPILPKVYAKTFVDLKEKAGQGAQLWQWWDYGYAGQYFAERRTFGDGGDHAGKVLYPLARVHATKSPLQAKQVMKFVLEDQMEVLEQQMENGTRRRSEAKAVSYPGDPVKRLRDMGPKKAEVFMAGLAKEEKDWPDDLPEQYLVLSWENLRLAYWISYYGNWDLVTGKSDPGQIQRVKGKVQFDLQKGHMKLKDKKIALRTLDVVNKKGTRSFSWNAAQGIHALMNQFTNEMYLMDSKMYNSMMVQMLIKDPKEFKEHFELVVDHFPWNRAYVVK
jgi:dolichyl-diphosphooligosaccharide--protein glycosyltransferase